MPPTLLLADDSLTIQRVVSLTFADQAIRVVVAKDGQDAINQMSAERPDLVLADTNMPCVDGYELARWVRQQPHLNTVPVLLLAGATDPVDEQRLHDSGANGVLEKPFEPSHVISRVKELLGLKTSTPAPATRLVTSPETMAARPATAGPAGAVPADRRVASPPAAPAPSPPAAPASKKPGSGIFRTIATAVADQEAATARTAPLTPEPAASPAPADEIPDAAGTPRDWFAGYDTGPTAEQRALAEELGVSGPRFHPSGEERRPQGPTPSSPSAADVFESLLAAEQGGPAPVVIRSAAPEITPEMIDHLATRIVERVPLDALRDELQRGIAHGLRETVTEIVRDSVATETRAAVAEAVQAAVNGTILGTVRGAVNEAVAAAVPTAVAHELRQAVAPLVQQTVRDIVGDAVRDAVAAAVPPAVLDAVRGEGGRQVNEIVRDTAERLVREEIERIRERR